MAIEVKDCVFNKEEIFSLYEDAGWTNYILRPGMIEKAFANSLCVLAAYCDGKFAGIIRSAGDGASILFIQDIIVFRKYQRQGIGTALIKAMLERYPDVYQTELLTDNTEKTVKFYESLGFRRASAMKCEAFVLIR